MFTLIKGGTLYSPENRGKKDILVAGKTIVRVADDINLPEPED